MNERREEHACRPMLPEAPLLQPWQIRAGQADAVVSAFEAHFEVNAATENQAARFMAGVDRQSHVGSRQHTVPKFVLERWAGKSLQVQTYSRIEEQFRTRNILDLAITDFYTFIDLDGNKDSSMESLLDVGVERPAATALRRLLDDPISAPASQQAVDVAVLAQFAAFQVVRTARHRRESELHAEWYAKTMAHGRVSDDELREISVVPHQNDSIRMMGDAALKLMALFACRPVALLLLDRPRLLIGDDPVLVNPGPEEATHHADCFLTDAQISARDAHERKRQGRRKRRNRGRVVHFSTTVPRGLGVGLEVVLPVSPRAALLWGPLQDTLHVGGTVHEQLDAVESERFAVKANDATCAQALDWVVSTPTDDAFHKRTIPPAGPLTKVCDGVNAASIAVNGVPRRLRPARLWQDLS